MSFKNHIAKVKNKLASSLFIFAKIRHVIPLSIAWSLYFSTFKSHLLYCLILWGNSHSIYLQPLNILHNRFLRNLLFLPSRTPTHLLLKQASALTISDLYKYSVAILIYKFINLPHTLPLSLNNLFHRSSQIHNYHTRAILSHDLFHLPCSSNVRSRHISISGPQIWNTIPLSLKNLSSLHIFKKQLHLFLISSIT